MHRFQGRLKVLCSRSDAAETQFKHQRFPLESSSEHLLLMCWVVRMDIQIAQGESVPSSHSDGASVSLGDLQFWPWHLLCNNYASILPDFSTRRYLYDQVSAGYKKPVTAQIKTKEI